MKLKTLLMLLVSHLSFGVLGVALGIYILPILTAPEAPTTPMVSEIAAQAKYTAEFKRDLKDSDALHWGEGTVSVDSEHITLMGELAPGPDYKLYLSKKFVETEAEFKQLKSTMVQVGNVTTFENFVVNVPSTIDVSEYSSVIVWCEAFGQFITAAAYK